MNNMFGPTAKHKDRVMILLIGLLFMFSPFIVNAKQNVVAVEGASYNVNATFADNLKAFSGKKVYLTLKSGKNIAGTVKKIGNHLLHLEKIDGKEYFDALIRIDDISAIDTRFRQIQR